MSSQNFITKNVLFGRMFHFNSIFVMSNGQRKRLIIFYKASIRSNNWERLKNLISGFDPIKFLLRWNRLKDKKDYKWKRSSKLEHCKWQCSNWSSVIVIYYGMFVCQIIFGN